MKNQLVEWRALLWTSVASLVPSLMEIKVGKDRLTPESQLQVGGSVFCFWLGIFRSPPPSHPRGKLI